MDGQRRRLAATRGPSRVHTLMAGAYALHARPELSGALVQVASQFNLLEMPSFDLCKVAYELI